MALMLELRARFRAKAAALGVVVRRAKLLGVVGGWPPCPQWELNGAGTNLMLEQFSEEPDSWPTDTRRLERPLLAEGFLISQTPI